MLAEPLVDVPEYRLGLPGRLIASPSVQLQTPLDPIAEHAGDGVEMKAGEWVLVLGQPMEDGAACGNIGAPLRGC
jgi:hypothetical protein